MAASLDQMISAVRRKVAERRASADWRELERQAETHVPRGFRRALDSRSRGGAAVIAELKKASPSRGVIRENFPPEVLAKELEGAGAAALSVLTNEEFFQGSLKNLTLASASTKLPCLRKDFIVDESQIVEARAHGADAILLIVAALSQAELTTLARRAADCGLDALSEVHDEQELQRAVDAGCDLIGVNSRDLRTFEVSLKTAFRLAELLPENALGVAESGIQNGADIARLRTAGYRAFLIGETLMKAPSPGQALRELLAAADVRSATQAKTHDEPWFI